MVEKIQNAGEYQDPTVQNWNKNNPSVYPAKGKINAKGSNTNVAQSKSDWTRFAARHNHGGNLLYADGHVEFRAVDRGSVPRQSVALQRRDVGRQPAGHRRLERLWCGQFQLTAPIDGGCEEQGGSRPSTKVPPELVPPDPGRTPSRLFFPGGTVAESGTTGCPYAPITSTSVGNRAASTHAVFPMAPARCATAVSTEMTRSRLEISAAVSAKSRSSSVQSVNSNSPRACSGRLRPPPFCRLYNLTPWMRDKGAKADSGIDRSRSLELVLLPAHANPTFSARASRQSARAIRGPPRHRDAGRGTAGDSVERGFERPRQAHERAVNVKSGQRLARATAVKPAAVD